jgi:hypothetical protein
MINYRFSFAFALFCAWCVTSCALHVPPAVTGEMPDVRNEFPRDVLSLDVFGETGSDVAIDTLREVGIDAEVGVDAIDDRFDAMIERPMDVLEVGVDMVAVIDVVQPPDIVQPPDVVVIPDVVLPPDVVVVQDVVTRPDVVIPTVTPDDLCQNTPTMFLSSAVGRNVYEGTTNATGPIGLGRNYAGSCNRRDTNMGEDVVYALRLDRTLRVSLLLESVDSRWDPALYITQDCTLIGDSLPGAFEHEIACMDDRPDGDRNPRFSVVLPTGDYRIVVDGASSSGRYRLTLDITEPEAPAAVEVIESGACPMVTSFRDIGPREDDGRSSDQTIPFPFVWYGASFTRLVASTNGFVQLVPPNLSASYWNNQAMPSTTAPNAVLAPWWDDLVTDRISTSNVRIGVVGATPNRAYVVQWRDASKIDDNATLYTFEVRLMETTNVVEFHYCMMNFATSARARTSATIGVESGDGLRGATYLLNADPGAIQGKILRFRAVTP